MSRDVHKYKPTNNLRHLLDDSVLDDATRRALMNDILTGPRPQLPASHGGAPPATSSSSSSAQTGDAHHHPSAGATIAPAHRPRVGSLSTQTSGPPTSAGRTHQPVPSAASSSSATPSTSGAEDLLVIMTQRLRAVEGQTSMLQKELKEKRTKVMELQDALEAEKASKKSLQDVVDAQAKELVEIHRFLSDYGLTWVGGTASGSTTPRSTSPYAGNAPAAFNLYDGSFDPLAATAQPKADPAASKVGATSGNDNNNATKPAPALPFDLELLKKNAEILSNHVGNLHIANVTGGAMIKERDTVYVCIYRDGISVNSGLFRPYGWPLCEAVISDLLEGFYPYEFREKYPDGFPITVVDKSTELGGALVAPKPTAGNNIHNVDSMNDHGYKPLSKDAFLRKLPERYVTASGHLVNIREGVQQVMVGGGTAAASVVDAKSDGTVTPPTAASKEAHGPTGGGNITAVQIKMPQGLKVVLHMYFHNTVKELREELQKAVPSFSSPYEFASMFPRRTYDDHALTLEEAQLVPNCTLMIKLLH